MANRDGQNTTPSSSSTAADIPIEVFVQRYLADVDEDFFNYSNTVLYCPNTGKGINVPNPPGSPVRYPIASGFIRTTTAGTGMPESSQRKQVLDELHTCHVCNMQFATLKDLQGHLRSHPAMDLLPGGGVRARPTFEGRGKAVLRDDDDDEVPRNTAASEIIDLTGDGDANGRPLANCKFSIDLNKPPPRDEDEDEDDGVGDIRPGLVA